VLYLIEDGCDSAWRGPEWLRPAVGGVLLGGLLLMLPQMYGVGYPVLGRGVAGRYTVVFLIVLLIGKMLATSLTIGIGGSGGVFAPSLFIGAMLGAAYGQQLHHLAPGLVGPAGAYGLIGMGAVFAGAARAPITAVVIMFELTGEYSIILPLMAAIVLATGVSHLLTGDTIYTLKLRRRGINLTERPPSALASVTAGQVMAPVGRVLPENSTLIEAIDALSRSRNGQLPVIDADGTYRGVLTARAAAEADGQHDQTTIDTVLERPHPVHTDTHLEDALDALESATGGAVPVLNRDDNSLVGWLTHQRVLSALRPTATSTTPPTAQAGQRK
jgi:chloride channel protein, CIC family